MTKQKTNWIVDAILFIGFQLTFFLDLTGLSWHQWLGVLIGAFSLYHILLHWKWVVAVTKRFKGNTSRKNRVYYLLDGSILLLFLMIGISGIWISTWLNLELTNYLFWKDLHVYSSIASLVLILLKIAVHWRWIVKTARSYFGLWKQTIPSTSPAVGSARPQSGSLNRREFLQLMGVAGIASLISATNLVEIGQAAGQSILEKGTIPPMFPDTDTVSSVYAGGECTVICEKGCSYPGQCRRYIDQNNNGICDLTECSESGSPDESPQQVAGREEEQAPSAADPGSGEGTAAQAASCVVLCPRSCQFPGECHDYIDFNSNGLCDYGECLEGNAKLEFPSSSQGGGRQRRGKK